MNEQYFAEYILEETERIRKFQNKLKNNEVREDRIYSVKRKIDAIQFELLIARYSAGEDIEKLENDFMQLLNDMPLYWNGNSSYIDMLWMMALAILFDVSREKFGILSDLVTQYNRKDALLEFFVNYKMNGNIGQLKGDYSYGFPYDKLTDIVANKEKAVASAPMIKPTSAVIYFSSSSTISCSSRALASLINILIIIEIAQLSASSSIA